jgi:ankyrin repeat protein
MSIFKTRGYFSNFLAFSEYLNFKCEIVEQVLSKGPNVNAVDKDGLTALGIACKEGYTDIALKLLNAGESYSNSKFN